jgi:hypothetical protein
VRKELKKIDNQRARFTGTFQRLGKKMNYLNHPEETVLLSDIKDENGKIVADHLWFNLTKSFEALGHLQKGDMIEFDARVAHYTKGYVYKGKALGKRQADFKLSHPTKVRKILP